jgi:phage protein D
MPESQVATSVRIEIDGQPLDPSVVSSVLHVIVDDHLLLPDTFEIALQETPAKDIAEQAHVKVGARVVISGSALGETAPSRLLIGEITALEGEYRETKAPTLVVRGYDKGHRLMQGRKSVVFRQKKYSDIAQAIAAGLGLDLGPIKDSLDVLPYVLQAGLTDWEFLNDLADEIGFQVAVTDGKFTFGPPPDPSSAPGPGDLNSTDELQLVFGQDLLEFRPRVTAASQVGTVRVAGWDMTGKKDLVSEQPAGTTSVELPDSPASIAAIFGSPVYASGNRPRTRQTVVDAAAKAIAERIGSAFAEANGIAVGNPKLKAGASVNVSLVALPFAGRYTLTHTRHVFDKKGYRTSFEVSGRQERTLLGLASGGGGGGAGAGGGMASVQVGLVTENADPDNLGRVRVHLPYLGHDFVTDWARVVAPGNGPDRGFVWIPEVHDEVLVAFHHGDISEPYVLGGLWNGVDAPPPIELDGGGKLNGRKIVSRDKNEVFFWDKPGNSSLGMATAGSEVIALLNRLQKEFAVTSDGKIILNATGDIEITATGSVKISGTGGVEISSPASTKVSGSGQLSLESGGMTSVKGATVSLG